jgi:hypothetical protein
MSMVETCWILKKKYGNSKKKVFAQLTSRGEIITSWVMQSVGVDFVFQRRCQNIKMTPHANYDTACTIDERFERPWQPLKGISIKNIYVPELSYPTPEKI